MVSFVLFRLSHCCAKPQMLKLPWTEWWMCVDVVWIVHQMICILHPAFDWRLTRTLVFNCLHVLLMGWKRWQRSNKRCNSFLNSCVNPVALYCVSGVFRQHFHRYLCCKQIQQTHHRLGMSMATHACDTSFMSTIRRPQHGNHHTIVHNGSSPTQSIIMNEKRWGTLLSQDTFL